jgi:hypothetical protein
MSAWTCRSSNGKADPKIVPPRLRIPYWKGLGTDSEEKHEPVSDIDTVVVVDSLKALDPERPIREADMVWLPCPGAHAERMSALIMFRNLPYATRFCQSPCPTKALRICEGTTSGLPSKLNMRRMGLDVRLAPIVLQNYFHDQNEQ